MKTITIRDIVDVVDYKDVARAKKYYYPTDRNDYEPIFEHLKTLKKQKHKNSTEFIEIGIGGFRDKILDKDPEERSQFYSMSTNLFSLSFRKWVEAVNIPIAEKTLNAFKIEEILAHFLWEITFYGTEKDAAKIARTMQRRVNQIKANPKKYTTK